MTSRAPGKIILSGEHAVVYGRPALVMAVERYATATAQPRDDAKLEISGPGFEPVQESLSALPERLKQTRLRHQGDNPVSFDHPLDLLLVAAALLFEQAPPTGLSPQASTGLSPQAPDGSVPASPDGSVPASATGLSLQLTSDIPLGCGMGSSAALLLVSLDAIARVFGNPLPSSMLDKLALSAEHFQHGRSSGVDPITCRTGGLLRFEQGQPTPLPHALPPCWLVDTGTPDTSTGACVQHVRETIGDSALWNQFAATTQYLETALAHNDAGEWIVGLRKNHDLLRTIGVVPEAVDTFLHEIERRGGGGKICGAGSISGDAGGMVLVSGVDEADVRAAASLRGFPCFPATVDRHGLRYFADTEETP